MKLNSDQILVLAMLGDEFSHYPLSEEISGLMGQVYNEIFDEKSMMEISVKMIELSGEYSEGQVARVRAYAAAGNKGAIADVVRNG